MDFRFSPEDEALRDEATQFVRDEWDPKHYDPAFYGKPEAAELDPVSTPGLGYYAGSEYWVGRGGAWMRIARECRSAFRYGFDHTTREGDLGFRPAVPTPP